MYPLPWSIRSAQVVRTLACLGGLALCTAAAPAHAQAQAPTEPASLERTDWTGEPQTAAIARKEAGAALVQGRRECARERDRTERAACLKLVNADHAAMLQRIARRAGQAGN